MSENLWHLKGLGSCIAIKIVLLKVIHTETYPTLEILRFTLPVVKLLSVDSYESF